MATAKWEGRVAIDWLMQMHGLDDGAKPKQEEGDAVSKDWQGRAGSRFVLASLLHASQESIIQLFGKAAAARVGWGCLQ